MGYDSTIVVGIKRSLPSLDKRAPEATYVQTIAAFDLCVMGYKGAFHTLLNQTKTTQGENRQAYIYPMCGGGDRIVVNDSYGSPLILMDPQAVLTALEEDEAREHYRRLPPAVALLKEILEEPGFKSENLVVLHYGH